MPELKTTLAETPRESTRACPNCKAELVKHGDANPFKIGAWHCDGCGSCWAPGMRTMRTGHPDPRTSEQ